MCDMLWTSGELHPESDRAPQQKKRHSKAQCSDVVSLTKVRSHQQRRPLSVKLGCNVVAYKTAKAAVKTGGELEPLKSSLRNGRPSISNSFCGSLRMLGKASKSSPALQSTRTIATPFSSWITLCSAKMATGLSGFRSI